MGYSNSKIEWSGSALFREGVHHIVNQLSFLADMLCTDVFVVPKSLGCTVEEFTKHEEYLSQRKKIASWDHFHQFHNWCSDKGGEVENGSIEMLLTEDLRKRLVRVMEKWMDEDEDEDGWSNKGPEFIKNYYGWIPNSSVEHFMHDVQLVDLNENHVFIVSC